MYQSEDLGKLKEILIGKTVEVFEIFFTFIDEMQSVSWKVEIEGKSLSILFNNYECFKMKDLSFPMEFNDLELTDCDEEESMRRFEIRSKEKNFGCLFEEFFIDPNGGHFMG